MEVIIVLFAIVVAGSIFYMFMHAVATFILIPIFGFSMKRFREPGYNSEKDPRIAQLLTGFRYYESLDESSKRLFVSRLRLFIEAHTFIGKEGLEPTLEMKVLISAAAIQLTFGLEKFLLEHFERIYIYPKVYYSRLNKKYHKGEVNLGGAMAFSWEDFKKGFADEDDNFNLGMHEMAHALRFDSFQSSEYDVYFAEYFHKFIAVGRETYLDAREDGPSYFRKYAGSNKEEFFSVCVENFFESPAEMKLHLPELYHHLCILLNQDPIGTFARRNVRESLMYKAAFEKGELVFSSKMSFSWRIIPFIAGFIGFSFIFIQTLNGNIGPSWSLLTAFLLVFYVAAGGFLISMRFTRIEVFQNGIVVAYPLNPMLGKTLYDYDLLVSATLNYNPDTGLYGMETEDNMLLSLADSKDIDIRNCHLGGIPPGTTEQIAAFLKKKKVMIKIFGNKWRHENIAAQEKLLPATFQAMKA